MSIYESNHVKLTSSILELIINNTERREIIINWIIDKNQEFISLQTLEIFSNIEELIFTGISKAQKDVLKIKLEYMKILYETNLKTNYLLVEDFYNEVLCEEFDPRIMFRNWLLKSKSPNQENNADLFTICDYKFLLDLDYKSRILNEESKFEMHEHRNLSMNNMMSGNILSLMMNPNDLLYFQVNVRREFLLEDALNQMGGLNRNFKMPLHVKFIGEQGVDEGGVRKEFFQIVTKQLFDPIFGMFIPKQESFWWFNPGSFESNMNFEMVGKILGLAIYNSIYLDVKFPLVVYKKILMEELKLEDLCEIDPELCKGLKFIQNYEGNIEVDLDLTFEIEYDMFDGKRKHCLIPDGEKIKVTNENKSEYIEKYWKWYLIDSVEAQFIPFKKGFYAVVTGKIFKDLFSNEELMILICGSNHLDFNELERASLYHDGYTKESPIINWLWDILKGFNEDQKKKFLAFATGSDRAPIKGLGYMNFVIGRKGADSEELPSAHTCFNHLLIPEYGTKEKLMKKLILAIENSEGFGLI